MITGKLAALRFYELAIPAPKTPEGSFDKEAALRGMTLFNNKAKYAGCYVTTLF